MKKQEKTPYHTTTIYRGKSYVTRECITGRLFFWDRHRAWSTKEGPIIVLLDEKSERAYLTAGDDLATVAIVFIGNTPSDALCSYACQKELPMLILNKLAAEHDAKIAILDSRTATLFVDPDLDTLSRYARHLRFGIDATLSPMLSPRFEAIPLSEHLPATLHRAKMLSPTEHAQLSLPQHEDALFEALRTLGEESREYPLLFPVRVYNLQSEESLASLRLRLRALLRAAVYGSFSLLFEGIYSEASAKQAFSVLKGVVEELSEESLEHNAHLPCGITAESFLLLHTLNTTLPIDYICLDWDRLVRSALPSIEEKAPTDEDRQAFLEMLHAYTNRLSLPICARTLHTPRIQPWPAEQPPPYKILSFFVPSEHILTWQEWLNKEK